MNFSVAEPVVLLLDTKLTVAQQCVLLNAGDVNLSATLETSQRRSDFGRHDRLFRESKSPM